jgi:hypothetical protein
MSGKRVSLKLAKAEYANCNSSAANRPTMSDVGVFPPMLRAGALAGGVIGVCDSYSISVAFEANPERETGTQPRERKQKPVWERRSLWKIDGDDVYLLTQRWLTLCDDAQFTRIFLANKSL